MNKTCLTCKWERIPHIPNAVTQCICPRDKKHPPRYNIIEHTLTKNSKTCRYWEKKEEK